MYELLDTPAAIKALHAARIRLRSRIREGERVSSTLSASTAASFIYFSLYFTEKMLKNSPMTRNPRSTAAAAHTEARIV